MLFYHDSLPYTNDHTYRVSKSTVCFVSSYRMITHYVVIDTQRGSGSLLYYVITRAHNNMVLYHIVIDIFDEIID